MFKDKKFLSFMAYKRRKRQQAKEKKRQKIQILAHIRDKFLLRQCFGNLYIHAIDKKRATKTESEKIQRAWEILSENYKNTTGQIPPYILKIWFFDYLD